MRFPYEGPPTRDYRIALEKRREKIKTHQARYVPPNEQVLVFNRLGARSMVNAGLAIANLAMYIGNGAYKLGVLIPQIGEHHLGSKVNTSFFSAGILPPHSAKDLPNKQSLVTYLRLMV